MQNTSRQNCCIYFDERRCCGAAAAAGSAASACICISFAASALGCGRLGSCSVHCCIVALLDLWLLLRWRQVFICMFIFIGRVLAIGDMSGRQPSATPEGANAR